MRENGAGARWRTWAGSKSGRILGTLALFAGVLAAYWPCLNGSFVWDDDAWTIHLRPLFSAPDALWRIWTQPTAMQQYYPLTGTSFWLDHRWWGEWTLPYHLQNVFWHAASACLLVAVLRRLNAPGAWLAGALFAVHPVMVESVAWLAERKNVLSLALFLAGLWCFVRYRSAWDVDAEPRGVRFYWAALVLFTAALLAKVTAYVFPPTVLLLCWWKRGRIGKKDVTELLPFFALSLAVGLVVSWVEKHHVGAEGPEWELPLPERLLLAGRALWFYVGKLLWPVDLRFMYPRWTLDVASPAGWLWPSAVWVAAGVMWWWRQRIPRGVFTAVFFFLGTIFPVLGFLNVYGMKFASVADHWNYVPSLAIFALVGAAIVRLARAWSRPWLEPAFAAVVLPVLGLLSWREAAQYRSLETLWLSTAARDPQHWMPQYSLGLHYFEQGRLEEAITRYRRSLELRPDHPLAYSNMGVALARLGRHGEAVPYYREALERGATLSDVHHNLGLTLMQMGSFDEAVVELREAISADPHRAEFHLTLASLWARKGWMDRAEESARVAVQLQPDNANARFLLGAALFQLGRMSEAEVEFRKVISAAPTHAAAHGNLAAVLLDLDRPAEATESARRAILLNPELASAYSNRGLAEFRLGLYAEALGSFHEALERKHALVPALAHSALIRAAAPDGALRDGALALELAQQAERLSQGQNPLAWRALAAAHAELGKLSEALHAAERARGLMGRAPERDQQGLAEETLHYQRGQPFRLPDTR